MKTILLSTALVLGMLSATFSPWRIVITTKDEPGESLIVTGRVFAPDGKTPVEGIRVHVYHTDAKGYYNPGTTSSQKPRLNGTMLTNEEGRYEYRTIRPASYPQSRNPAHVHYVISGKGDSEQYDELEFEGDPFLTEEVIEKSRKLGTFGVIQKLQRDVDGIWRTVKDIRLKK
jgi:protocatechuate 3,4-dioxygenase beta subunit